MCGIRATGGTTPRNERDSRVTDPPLVKRSSIAGLRRHRPIAGGIPRGGGDDGEVTDHGGPAARQLGREGLNIVAPASIGREVMANRSQGLAVLFPSLRPVSLDRSRS
jgi:hypothetical protein